MPLEKGEGSWAGVYRCLETVKILSFVCTFLNISGKILHGKKSVSSYTAMGICVQLQHQKLSGVVLNSSRYFLAVIRVAVAFSVHNAYLV